MADLPETEILRRQLQSRFVGHSVVEAVGADVVGQALDDVSRHGRNLILHFGPWRLLLPMGRTARLTMTAPQRAALVRLRFASGDDLWYVDAARRPKMALLPGDSPGLRSKGAEPLSGAFSLGAFKRILGKRTRSVKFALSEDELVAGLGTLYPDEILHLAGIRPERAVSNLTEDEKRDLYFAIFQILHKAIRFGGLSGNGYTLEGGKAGGFERFAGVVRREGERCPSCQGRVRRLALERQQAWFCPRCQH